MTKTENEVIDENKELKKALYDIMYITDPLGHFGHEKAHRIAYEALNRKTKDVSTVCAKCGGSGVIGNGPTSFNPQACDCGIKVNSSPTSS